MYQQSNKGMIWKFCTSFERDLAEKNAKSARKSRREGQCSAQKQYLDPLNQESGSSPLPIQIATLRLAYS